MRALTVSRPSPKLPEAARTERAFQEFEQALTGKFEQELAQNKDTNSQTGPYVRKRLMLQLLSARKNDPSYVAALKQKFPTYAPEIDQAVQELNAWRTPLDARANNSNAVVDQLIWPQPAHIPATLTAQAQSANADYRRRVATDLVARMRLVKNDAYAAIEGAIPQIFPQARLVAARMAPDEYPLLRLELLSLPLADTNRVYYIRNLAIDIQNLMTQNNEGQTIRGAVHNQAGPANVPLVAQYLLDYFHPDSRGTKPDPDTIALLMLARRWLKAGDLSAVLEVAGTLRKAMKDREPSLEKVFSASDPAVALSELDAFITANVRLQPKTQLDASMELFPSTTGQPVSQSTKQMIADCARAIDSGDSRTAYNLATQVTRELQQIQYQFQWHNVQTYLEYWTGGHAGYDVHARQVLAQFLAQAQIPSAGDLRTVIKTHAGAPVDDAVIDRLTQFVGALAQNQLDVAYPLYAQLVNELRDTNVHASFSQYEPYITPQYRNQYNASTILGWVLPALRGNNNQNQWLKGGTSSNATYSAIDVYEKLAELYEELSALYNSKADIAMLERAFPMWAPKTVREGLYRTTAHLKAGDKLFAAKEIASLRQVLRNEIIPSETPMGKLLATLERAVGDHDPELSALSAAIRANGRDATDRLENLFAQRASNQPLTRSKLQVGALGNNRHHPVPPETPTQLTELVNTLIDGDAQRSKTLIAQLTPQLQHYNNWLNYVARTAANSLNASPPQFQTAYYYVAHFLLGNATQVQLSPGSISDVPPLKGPNGAPAPDANALAALKTFLDRTRANDQAGARGIWPTVQRYFSSYPSFSTTLAHAGNLTGQAQVALAVPLIEEFILQNRGVTDEEIKRTLKLASGKKAPPEAIRSLLELRATLREPTGGQENLRLIQLDGLLEDISTNLLASIGEELGEITDDRIGAALVAMQAALGSAIAGGLVDVKGSALGANRMLTPFGSSNESSSSSLPELHELSERIAKLMEKTTFKEEEVVELRTVADQISERVWQVYVDLKAVFDPRLEKAQQQGVSDPFFVDNLIKQGPLTHVKALADAIHGWTATKLGVAKSEAGAVLENPKGVRVMSEGRAVLQRIVIAETLKDVPRKAVLDENTLLILGTVGNENISMAGSVVVNRAKADGSGAGGQFSHIFVWTRNTGIAGVAFENATQVVAEFQERFADKLAAGEEVYLEAGSEGFRLATVSEAQERGWMTPEEKESLRPGLNTFVRFMIPDGSGTTRAHLDSIHINRKRPGKPFLEIDIAYPMAELNHLGDAQIDFAELLNAGPNGAHADSLVGPKAAVLARARRLLNWQNVVLPGQSMPFGQVYRLLEDSGAIDEIRRIEPAMSLDADGFWSSRIMNDGAYRSQQCEKIQSALKKKLFELFFEADGKTLTAIARREIIDPLKANRELLAPDGKLKPLIARSSANSEDSADFNAAGKHKSVANLVTEEAIVEAAIEVIASLHNIEAVETRRFFGVDSRLSAMSVLFQPVVPADVSGVLVTRPEEGSQGVFAYQATRGLFGGVHGDAQIQVSELGPNANQRKVIEPYRAATMAVLDPNGGGVVEQPVPPEAQSAANLLTPQQEQTLYTYATQLKQFFQQHVYPGQKDLELDIEFMIQQGQVYITQARPLPGAPV